MHVLWGVHSLCNLYTSSGTVLVRQNNLYKLCTSAITACTCMKQAHKACVACTCKRLYSTSLYGLVLVYSRYRRSPWSLHYRRLIYLKGDSREKLIKLQKLNFKINKKSRLTAGFASRRRFQVRSTELYQWFSRDLLRKSPLKSLKFWKAYIWIRLISESHSFENKRYKVREERFWVGHWIVSSLFYYKN